MTFTANQLDALRAALANEIPISNSIGLTIESFNQNGLTLSAPLAPNINHKDTAFAGSLNAVLTLAGWSMVWLIVSTEAIPAKVVIQDSAIRYLRPVTRDFSALCRMASRIEVERFLLMLRRKGRAARTTGRNRRGWHDRRCFQRAVCDSDERLSIILLELRPSAY